MIRSPLLMIAGYALSFACANSANAIALECPAPQSHFFSLLLVDYGPTEWCKSGFVAIEEGWKNSYCVINQSQNTLQEGYFQACAVIDDQINGSGTVTIFKAVNAALR